MKLGFWYHRTGTDEKAEKAGDHALHLWHVAGSSRAQYILLCIVNRQLLKVLMSLWRLVSQIMAHIHIQGRQPSLHLISYVYLQVTTYWCAILCDLWKPAFGWLHPSSSLPLPACLPLLSLLIPFLSLFHFPLSFLSCIYLYTVAPSEPKIFFYKFLKSSFFHDCLLVFHPECTNFLNVKCL